MTRRTQPGDVWIAQDMDDTSVQVATAVHKHTGHTVVLLRLGDQVVALEPAAAATLADGLKLEAAFAMQQALARGEGTVQ